MKKNMCVVLGALLLFSTSFLVYGCSQQETEGTTTTTTSTTTTTTASINNTSISGSLYTGSIRSAGVRSFATAYSAISSYQVLAVGTTSNKVYFADGATDSDGSFTISNLPSGESFMLEIIDDNNKFVAPVSLGNTATEVIMAVTSEAGGSLIDLGEIVYQSSKGVAVPTLEVSAANLDDNITATAKSGETFVPVGAGSLGRGTGEALYSGTLADTIDGDLDGLPDVVDIDDDGDGSVDGNDGTPRRTDVQEISGAAIPFFFSNLAKSYLAYPSYIDSTFNTTPINLPASTVLAVHISLAEGYSPSYFSAVQIVAGPPWLSSAIISTADASVYSDYPQDGRLWGDENYKLYEGSENWGVWVIPNGTPEAGDVFKFKTTNASTGTEEYSLATLTYVFTDIPRLVAYTDSAGTKEVNALSLATYEANENKFNYTGDTLTLSWLPPQDDQGNPLTDLEWFSGSLSYFDVNGTQLGQMGLQQLTPTSSDHPQLGTVLSATLTVTNEANLSFFQLDLIGQTFATTPGDASQIIYFKEIP
ncbi:MAG: hypothetical protein ABH823_05385 [bacterium]